MFLEGGKCITWFAQNRQWEVRCVRAVCVRAVCVRACVCCVCVLCVRVRRASCIVRRVCVRVVWYTHPIHPTPPSSFLLEYNPTHCQNPFLNPFLNPFQGTPVVQRLINCAGGKNADGKTVKATPVRQRIVKCSVWRNIYTEK